MSLLTSSFHQVSLLAIDISLQSSFSTIPTHHHSLATLCWLAYWALLLDKLKRFNQTTKVLLFSKERHYCRWIRHETLRMPPAKLHRNPWNPKVPPLYLSSDLTCSCVTTEHLLSPSKIQPRVHNIAQAPGHHSPILFVSQVSSGLYANFLIYISPIPS